MAKYLITGGAGFIGGNFLNLMVNKYPENQYVCIDSLTYAGNMETLAPIMNKPNFKFVHENICNREAVFKLFEEEHFDFVINFAAESHVDRSIDNPNIFTLTNVVGTQNLLNACVKYGIKRFHQVSTDEVYGDIGFESNELCDENSPLRPSSPYSASKASADLLVLSYHRTYKLPVTISRSSNNYGPYQNIEKLIPLMIHKALNNEKLPIYGNGLNMRDWIYVDDYCEAIDLIVKNGISGNIYNVKGNNELTNIDIVKRILNLLNKDEKLIEFVKDRPGHDLRYGMNDNKIKHELNFHLSYSFDEYLNKTILWYINNQDWVKKTSK